MPILAEKKMSWLDNIKNNLIIKTGNGSQYKPNWLNATKSVEYNISEFEFIDVDGTYVNRSRIKGRRFNIEIYFQGEDHLFNSRDFEISAEDPRPWTIIHPFYGALLVQPLSLGFDNTDYNVTKITGVVVETIGQVNPQVTVDPTDKIVSDKADLDSVVADSFVTNIPKPDTEVINDLKTNTKKLYLTGISTLNNDLDAQNYFNLFNQANAAITLATSFPLEAINDVIAVINEPALFADTVKNRITTLVNQFNQLVTTIENLTSSPSNKESKIVYENNGNTLVSAMAVASVTNATYANRDEVFNSVNSLLNTYNLHLANLDGLQNDNGGNPDSYIPDADSLMGLSDLINFTISNLFAIAINSKQERFIYLENESNWILLAHRFYGLEVDDSTLNDFMQINGAGLNEMLQVRKGRKIVWFV